MISRVVKVLAGVSLALAPAARAGQGDAMFKLSDAHLRLLRQATVLWTPVESGAPAILISPLEMEDGPSDKLEADVAARAGLTLGNPPSAAELERVKGLIADLPEALAQLLAHGKLAAGSYDYRNPLVDFAFAARSLPPELAPLATKKIVTFAFTDRHAALLRGARWRGLWMNAKRPYGDMTYFELDMAAILGDPVVRDQDGRLPPEQEKRLGKLHAETLPALQVFLQKATLAPGEYARLPVEPGLLAGRGNP